MSSAPHRSVRLAERLAGVVGLLVAMGTLASAPAAAQDADRFSLVIGGHAQVGVLVPLTGSITLRPDLRLRRSSFSGVGMTANLTEGYIGLATLHYLSRDERLRTYWSPRVATRFRMMDPDDDTDTEYWLLTVSYGANAAVTERFGVFAEAGPQFIYTEASNPAFPPTVITRDLSLAGVIGVTIRF